MKSEIIVFNEVSLKISETNIIENLNFSISSGDFTYLIWKTEAEKAVLLYRFIVIYQFSLAIV